MRRAVVLAGVLGAVLVLVAPAGAAEWLPHGPDATWTYSWSDSKYNPTATKEKVTVKSAKGDAFVLEWTTADLGNPPEAPVSVGTVSFQETNAGLVNTDWTSNAPPPGFPVLCASLSQCGNSLASTYYNVIWGNRVPVLPEPLVTGMSWSATGGTQNDVGSESVYAGVEKVSVPAFPQPVLAAKIRTQITQAGALGDPYGSGLRVVWWVYGVGPVKVVFRHAGGASPPVTRAVLESTNLAPKPPPTDANYFPLDKGLSWTYRWTNKRHLSAPVVEKATITAAVNSSAQIEVQNVSGPIKVAAAYAYTSRLDGVTNLWGKSKAASLAKLPPLGPRSLPPKKRRHFFTPFDLMNFGFNPVLPAYPAAGGRWSYDPEGRDFAIYGVKGSSRVLGVRRVKVPAGTFRAIVVQSTLRQPGFRFGSGTRTMWFAPGRGLVKLVFRHADKSVSVVELLK